MFTQQIQTENTRVTCAKASPHWPVSSRNCTASDLFTVAEGAQCANCGAIRFHGSIMSYDFAIAFFGKDR
jgi:hypothetical protein